MMREFRLVNTVITPPSTADDNVSLVALIPDRDGRTEGCGQRQAEVPWSGIGRKGEACARETQVESAAHEFVPRHERGVRQGEVG